VAIKQFNEFTSLTGLTLSTAGGTPTISGGEIVTLKTGAGAWDVTGWYVDTGQLIASGDMLFIRCRVSSTNVNYYGMFGLTTAAGLNGVSGSTNYNIYFSGNLTCGDAIDGGYNNTFAATRGSDYVFRYTFTNTTTIDYRLSTNPAFTTLTAGAASDWTGDTIHIQGNFDMQDTGAAGAFTCAYYYITDSTGLPDVPSNVAAVAGSDPFTEADASWDAVYGADSYNVYVDGVLFSNVATNSETVTGLSPDTSYDITVSSVTDALGESAESSAATITTEGSSDPGADLLVLGEL
jgi:hypothetical protein